MLDRFKPDARSVKEIRAADGCSVFRAKDLAMAHKMRLHMPQRGGDPEMNSLIDVVEALIELALVKGSR